MKKNKVVSTLQPLTLILGFFSSQLISAAAYEFQDQVQDVFESTGQLLLSPNDIVHLTIDSESLKQPQSEQIKSDYDDVLRLIKQNKMPDAEKKVDGLLSVRPDVAVFHDLKALLSVFNNDPESAEKSYQKAIRLNPNDLLAYFGMAKLAMAENKLDQAKKYAERAIAINDKAIHGYFILADVALKQKKLDEVEDVLLKAQQKVKGNISAELNIVRNLGKFYAVQKKPEKILAMTEELNNRYPNNIKAISVLTSAQLANNQRDQAKSNLRRIIDANKEDITHRLLLASILGEETGQEKQALALMDETAKINPSNPQAKMLKATYLIRLGRTKDAIKIADELGAQFPKLSLGKILQGNAYLADKKLDEATQAYHEAYRIQANARTLLTLTNLLNVQNKREEAIKLLNEALAEKPNNLALRYKLAAFYQALNNTEQAERHYLLILEKQPNNVLALNDLAWMYAQQGNPKALGLAKKAFDKAPKSAAVSDTYGYILLQHGKLEESLAILEKAAALAPKSADIQYHLAKAYLANDNRHRAVEILHVIVNSAQNFSERGDALELLKHLSVKP